MSNHTSDHCFYVNNRLEMNKRFSRNFLPMTDGGRNCIELNINIK